MGICTTTNTNKDVWIYSGHSKDVYGVVNMSFNSNSVTISYTPEKGNWNSYLAFNTSSADYNWVAIG